MRIVLGLLAMTVSILITPDRAEAAATIAGSVQVIGSTLQYTAYAGLDNVVDALPVDATHLDLADSAGSLGLVGPACVASPTTAQPGKVTCDVTGLSAVVLDGGDGNDQLSVRDPMAVNLIGGPGDDALTGWSGNDILDGGPGDDALVGGAGNDLLIGGPGADVLDGGPGTDIVSYASYALKVVADPDDQQGDDGAAGERDTVRLTVEALVGGSNDDMLTGSSGPNSLDGGPGADVLVGGAGDDVLGGGAGADQLSGQEGADKLSGDAGFDQLDGGTDTPGGIEKDYCWVGADGGRLAHCEIVQ